MTSWRMYAHRSTDAAGHTYYAHFYPDYELVSLHFIDDPIVQMELTENPDGKYWGWIDSDATEPCLIQSFDIAFEAQFEYGSRTEVARGKGRVIRLDVKELGQCWRLWANRYTSDADTEYYADFGVRQFAQAHGGRPVQVVLIEDANGPYWGWLPTGESEPSIIEPHESRFTVCFPYGVKAEVEAGQGRVIRLNVRPYEGN